MSSLSDNPLASLVRYIANDCEIRIFVETGTAHGTSAFFASQVFDHVVTIDKIQEFQDEARRRQADWQSKGLKLDNIEYVLGDTREVLEPILKSLRGERSLYWLDAHAFPGGYNSARYECPLMTELELINQYDPYGHSWVLIDDVHDLNPPMDPDTYPPLRQVIQTGVNGTGRICVVAHDVVVLAPEGHAMALRRFKDAVG